MKKQRKRTLRPFELWNPGVVEQWLEDEAARGWRLTDCGGWFATFEAVEPKQCRVRVHPQGPEARETFLERIAAYEEMGWTYAAAIERDFEIFYCDDPAIPELFSDPMSYGWAWEKQLKRARRNAWGLLLLPLFVLVMLMLSAQKTVLQTVLNMSVFLMFVTVVLCPLLIVLCARRLWVVRMLRKQIAAGVKPERNGNWRKNRLWWRVIVLLYLLYWVSYSGGMVGSKLVKPDTKDLLYVSGEQLIPGSHTEDWNLEAYRLESTPLNLVHYEIQLYTTEQRRVCNINDKVRFTFLAEALYQEKLEELLSDWPEAEQTAVENNAFDEAVLLTGGEDVQILLVRKGKLVYSLWVNFPADLSVGIERAAEYLSE